MSQGENFNEDEGILKFNVYILKKTSFPIEEQDFFDSLEFLEDNEGQITEYTGIIHTSRSF